MSSPDRAGAASSLVGVVQQLSAALLGAIVGYTLGRTAWPLAAAVATMGCLALGLWVISNHAMTRATFTRGGPSHPLRTGTP
jgi:DHA1 family bicyclomycin/chloramphenicol resistance-like MFS transporter